jgi:hypothetical protein
MLLITQNRIIARHFSSAKRNHPLGWVGLAALSDRLLHSDPPGDIERLLACEASKLRLICGPASPGWKWSAPKHGLGRPALIQSDWRGR